MNKTERFIDWMRRMSHSDPRVDYARRKWLDSVVPGELEIAGEPCLVWKARCSGYGDPQIFVAGKNRGSFSFLMEFFFPREYAKMERQSKGGRRAWRKCSDKRCVSPYHRTTLRMFDNPQRKLTDDEVRAIRADTRVGWQIAAEYGVRSGTVNKIRSGRSYRNVPGPIQPPINHARFQRTLDADTIHAVRAAEGSQREIAERFGLHRTQVRDIRKRLTYRDV